MDNDNFGLKTEVWNPNDTTRGSQQVSRMIGKGSVFTVRNTWESQDC